MASMELTLQLVNQKDLLLILASREQTLSEEAEARAAEVARRLTEQANVFDLWDYAKRKGWTKEKEA